MAARSGNRDESARTQHAMGLGKRLGRVGQVVEDVEQRGGVEGAIWEGQRGGVAEHFRRGRPGEHPRRAVESDPGAVGQVSRRLALAAADVEHRGSPPRRAGGGRPVRARPLRWRGGAGSRALCESARDPGRSRTGPPSASASPTKASRARRCRRPAARRRIDTPESSSTPISGSPSRDFCSSTMRASPRAPGSQPLRTSWERPRRVARTLAPSERGGSGQRASRSARWSSRARACEAPLETPQSVCQRERCPAGRVWRNGSRNGVGSRHGHPHNRDRRSRRRSRHRRDPVRSVITFPLAVSEE